MGTSPEPESRFVGARLAPSERAGRTYPERVLRQPDNGGSMDPADLQDARAGKGELGIQNSADLHMRTKGSTADLCKRMTGVRAVMTTSDRRHSSLTVRPARACVPC